MQYILYLLFFLSVTPCSGEPLNVGPGEFAFVDPRGNPDRPIRVFYYRPKKFRSSGPIHFVMHGMKRNGKKYRDQWIKHSETHGFLLLVPEFSKQFYGNSRHYNRGFMYSDKGHRRDPAKWTFTAIERIFDRVIQDNKLGAERYSIYGHSAGGQFVHRFVLFMPDARYKLAIAANSGWYTMPTQEVAYPYGLGGTEVDEAQLEKVLQRRLVLLLGSDDTDTESSSLKKTSEANAQGPHRFARGKEFIQQSHTQAKELGIQLKWKKKTVRGVGHSNKKMAPAAARMIR